MIKVTLHKTVRKNKKGTRVDWNVRWFGSDGKRYGETIGDTKYMGKRDAEAARVAKQGRLNEGTEPVDRPDPKTLDEWFAFDLRSLEGDKALGTIRIYETAFELAKKALGDDRKIEHIKPKHAHMVEAYLKRKRKPNQNQVVLRSAATRRKLLSALRASFARAHRLELIRANPFAGRVKGKTQPKPARIFSAAEIAAMIEVAPTAWWKAFIELGVSSGLRLAEMLHLHWDDIDFGGREDGKRPTVTVSRKDAGTFVANGAEYPIVPFVSKSHQQRTVPIAWSAADRLAALRLKAGGNPYVFISLERLELLRGRTLRPSDVANNVPRNFASLQQRAQERLQQDAWKIGSPHDLRKTYGTRMAEAGLPITDLRDLMGHSSVKTTEVFYVTATQSRTAEAMDHIDRMMRSTLAVATMPAAGSG